MLEIDGEFFEDPCEDIRAGRIIIVVSIIEMAAVQAQIILEQPLFPPKFATGGIVNPSTLKGDEFR